MKEKATLLSVLGTGNYGVSVYEMAGKKEEDMYIQSALYRMLREEYDLELKIFLTKKAGETNWEGEGLASRLQKLQPAAKVETIAISDGKNEEEIWENFQYFYHAIQERDKVFVDITHSFRSIPIILLSVLELAKRVKKIEVLDIFYGTFEKENYAEGKAEQVISLSVYNQIADWENAISRFLETGYAQNMAGMAKKLAGSIIKKTDKREEAQLFALMTEMRNLAMRIEEFSEKLFAVRGREICESVFAIRKTLQDLEKIDGDKEQVSLLQPFYICLEPLKQLFAPFKEENTKILNMCEIVKLCIRFNLLQQGLTFLEENITSYLVENYTGESNEANMRKKREHIAEEFYETEDMELLKRSFPLEKEVCENIRKIRKDIKGLRNDINHAGFRESAAKYKSLSDGLSNNLYAFVAVLGGEI
ncbi:TIGR02221 family CRISPR-associated protein [Bacteroides heparinolyticus]|uniref:TIGR02221 family CRISPR-associated protein n=1 Tax=Prevotella heparinolytica TaxID=28113 RepID=UPI0035A11B82